MAKEIKSMSPATIKILKATAPVVQSYGTQITEYDVSFNVKKISRSEKLFQYEPFPQRWRFD